MIVDIRTGDETIHLEIAGETKVVYTPPACSERQLVAYQKLYEAAVVTLKAASGSESLVRTNVALHLLQEAVDKC